MNIFKSLSMGNGRISETNITSFLSYLLNTSHELHNSFLLLFLKLVDQNTPGEKVLDLLDLKHASLRDQLLRFSDKFTVSATPEFSLKNDQSQKITDIFLRLSTRHDESDVCYLLIENKIKRSALNLPQVSVQYDHFLASQERVQQVPVYSILLTTDSDTFAPMYHHARAVNPNSVWLRWTNHQQQENSVEAVLKELIKFEQQADISPINPNTQFIIRSFIDYIGSEFSYRGISDKKNYSYNGFDVISEASASLHGERYLIKRFSNNMIRVFDQQDELINIVVKPLLEEINQAYSLGIAPTHTTGIAKNTQVYGRDVIQALNSLIAAPIK